MIESHGDFHIKKQICRLTAAGETFFIHPQQNTKKNE